MRVAKHCSRPGRAGCDKHCSTKGAHRNRTNGAAQVLVLVYYICRCFADFCGHLCGPNVCEHFLAGLLPAMSRPTTSIRYHLGTRSIIFMSARRRADLPQLQRQSHRAIVPAQLVQGSPVTQESRCSTCMRNFLHAPSMQVASQGRSTLHIVGCGETSGRRLP
jgi:hypothetical protein